MRLMYDQSNNELSEQLAQRFEESYGVNSPKIFVENDCKMGKLYVGRNFNTAQEPRMYACIVCDTEECKGYTVVNIPEMLVVENTFDHKDTIERLQKLSWRIPKCLDCSENGYVGDVDCNTVLMDNEFGLAYIPAQLETEGEICVSIVSGAHTFKYYLVEGKFLKAGSLVRHTRDSIKALDAFYSNVGVFGLINAWCEKFGVSRDAAVQKCAWNDRV